MSKRVATSPGAMAGGEEGGGLALRDLDGFFARFPGLLEFWQQSVNRWNGRMLEHVRR